MFEDFEIKPRELIVSLGIICILTILGIFISGKISNWMMDKNEIYNKAVRVDDPDTFKYMIDTDIGYSFVYGNLKAIDTVSMGNVIGYMVIKRDHERYTRHTRTVTYTSNGKTRTRTEVYYTWDHVKTDWESSNYVSFLNVNFPKSKFDVPLYYLKTEKFRANDRYKYYVADKQMVGSAFMNIHDHDIFDVNFAKDVTLDEALDTFSHRYTNLVFWIIWSIFMIFVCLAYCYLDNAYLD